MHEHSGFLSLQKYRLVGLNLLCLGDFPCHLVASFLLEDFCYPAFATQAVIRWYILSALFGTLLSLKSCRFQAAAIPAVFACSFCLPPELFPQPQQQLWHLGNSVLLGCATHLVEKLLLFKLFG